jgi:hypothetical protein
MDKVAVEEVKDQISEQEIEMGKELGMFEDEKPETVEETVEEKANDDAPVESGTGNVEEAKPEAQAEEDLSPEKEEAIVKNFNANEKKLYWERKKERIKRQEAQREKELTAIQLAAAKREIELLKTGAPKSVEDSEEKEAQIDEDDERIMTVGEFKRMQKAKAEEAERSNAQAQEIIKRVEVQEVEAKAKYADYDEVTKLAAEVIKTNRAYARVLAQAASDPNENVAEVAYHIGKLHPKYGKAGEPVKKTENNQINRAIKNSEKRVTSAAVSGGGGKTAIGEADLTVEDVAKMNPREYAKLSPETRERILRESCGL